MSQLFFNENRVFFLMALTLKLNDLAASLKCNASVKSRFFTFFVIPAQAGIQSLQAVIDSRLRGNDVFGAFYKTIKFESLSVPGFQKF